MQLPFAVNPKGSPFIELQSVDSSNKYAMELIHAGMAQHGMAVFAHEQTSGKGQRGKEWSSEKGANIALSIIINPFPILLPEQFKLSVFTAITVHEFFSRFSGDETKLKWPNDIYWRDRKAGGILIENVVRSQELKVGSQKSAMGNWQWAIIGIGININQTSFPPDLPNPVSLKQITGKDFVPVDLAKELSIFFLKNLKDFNERDFETIFLKYQSLLYKKDEIVKLKKGSRVFEATIKAVSQSGQLITQHAIEERFDFGQIEWMI